MNHITHEQAKKNIQQAVKQRQYNNSLEGRAKNAIQNALVEKIGFDTLEKDQESIAKRLQENAKKVEAGEYVDPKEYDYLVADSESLGKRLGYYRNYIRNAAPDNADAIKNATDMSKAFLDASKSMGEQQKFFSNFKDADDYKKQMDAYKEQQRLTFEYDLEAGKKLLDAAKGKAQYKALKKEYDLAKYYQTDYKYSKLSENEDFEKKSKKANTAWDIGETAAAANYINGRWDSKVSHDIVDFLDKINIFDNDETVDAYNRYDHMTDDQVKTFNYIYNTQGQKKAQAYLDFIEGELAQKYAQKNKTSNFFVNALRALNAGTESLGEGLENLGLGLVKEGANLFTGGNTGSFGKAVDNFIKDNAAASNSAMALAARKNEAGAFENFLYDVAQTTPTTLANMLPGGFVVTSLSAAGNAYAEATAEDKNSMQRIFMAIGEGSMEAITNWAQAKLGGEALDAFVDTATKNMGKTLGKSIAGNFIKYGYHSLSEGLEEAIQEIAGTGLRNMVYGEENKINWGDVGYAALLGATSAGILKSPSLVNDVYSSIKLPAPTESHFKETLDTAPEGSSLAERFNALTGNLEIQDSLMSADAIANVIEGHYDKAYKIIDDQIETYKYAKEYNKRNIGAKTDYFDTQISLLGTMKNLIESGKFNAEAARNATMQSTTLWQIAAENNDSAAKVLLQDGLSNAQIEKTVLTDKGTQKAFERLTGVNLSQYKTVSQKRNAVKVTAQAYQAFASSDVAKQVTDILKANNTISDAAVRSENRVKAQKALEAAYKEAAAEDSLARKNGDINGAKVAQAKMKLIDHVKNDVRNGNVLSFASLDGSAAVNNARKYTENAPKVEPKVHNSMAIERDLAEVSKGVNEEYINMLDVALEKGKTFTEAEKEVLGNIDSKIEQAKGEERSELIEQRKKLQEYLELEKASFEETRDLMKQYGREEFRKRAERHQKTLKQYGIDLAIENGGELYFDENKNLITEEEYNKLKADGKKVSVVFQNGIHTERTIKIFDALAFGRYIRTLDFETGEITLRRSGIDFNAREGVDFVIGHELVHEGETVNSGIVNSILNSIGNTKLDSYYEIGKRRAGKKTSEEADKHWNALKELYIKAEMKNGDRAKAEAKVTDAYMYEEIAADYMGMLLAESGDLDTVASKGGLITKIKLAMKALISRLKGDKLDVRAERVKELMKKLDAVVKSNYGKLAKTTENAQKSTESEAKTEDEQAPAETEKRAENDERMMVVGGESETADLGALDTAIAMLKSDPNADTVSETGWWLGKDGKWRYEIADNDMRFERDGLYKNPQTLEDYIEHDKLFEAYPWLRNVRVEIVDSIGKNPHVAATYNEGNKTISIRKSVKDSDAIKRDLIHEIQHAVQQFEEFKGGSNPNNAAFYLLEMYYHQVKNMPQFKQIKTPEGKKRFIIRRAENRTGKAFEDIAFDAYYFDHGEIEARESADRIEMSEKQRRENPIANDGIVFDEKHFEERMIDILQDIGYTKNQIYDFYKNGDFFNDELANVSQSERSIQSRSERNYAGRRRQSQETVGENAETRRRVHGSVESGSNNAANSQASVRGLRRDNQVKFSVSPEADEDYLSAVENGDMDTAQRMVDEAAKKTGYTIKAYHGTSARFTQFDPDEMSPREGSYFFAENREDAAAYGKNIYEVYLTDRNLADYDNQPTEFYKLRDKRQQVEWLKERGYEGWYADMDSEGWGEYSVFSPSQVKSADPVTYDDNGNVIPLSERFNEGNEDIRWSISPSLDSDIDSVLNGTFDASRNEVYLGKTSQFMTDVIGANSLALYMPAAKVYSSILTRDEYNKKPYYSEQGNYHGIGKEDFIDILERSENPIAAFADTPDINGNKRHNRIVLVTDKIIKDAETGEEGYAVVVEEVDAVGRNQGKTFKANKAITVYERTHLLSDIQMAIVDGRLLAKTKKGEHLLNMRRGANSQATIREDVLKKNIANFWANVKWANEKNKIYSSSVTPTTTAMEDAIKNSSYYKSMQNSENDTEGRMSVSEEVAEESEQTYAELKREAEKLKQRNAKLAHEVIRTHGKEVDPKSATALLKDIIEKYQGTIKAKDILAKFEEVYTYANTKGANVDELMQKLNDIATDIFNSAVEYDDIFAEYGSLLKELRETGITVSVEDRGGDFDDVGGWNEFRKKSIGNVKFVNEGLPVDSYYQELSTQYPHLFDEKITHPAEQAKEIASVARKLREIGVTPKDVYAGVDEEIVINGIMGDLYSALKNADKKATFADKAAQKVHDAYLAEKMHYGAKIAELKRKNEKREQIIVEKFESRIDKLTENHHKAYQEKMVRSRAKDIAKRLTRPTKTKHVPAMMAGDVGAFLSKIQWASDNVGHSEYAAEMRELLAKAPKEITKESDDANTFSQDLLDDMRDFAPGKTVEEMSAKEAYELNVLLMRVIHEINNQDKIFHSTAKASALATRAITQFASSRKSREFAGIRNKLIDFIRYGAADPEAFFNALGIPVLTEAYQNLAKRQNVFARTLRELTERMSKIVNGEIPKSWREDYKEYTLANGQKVYLTPVQKMSLYLLSNQVASKKRLLSERGGIVPTATERNFVWRQNENGKDKVKLSVPKTTLGKRVYLTDGDLVTLEGTLTEEQRDIANKLSELLNGRCAELGNEVSLAEDGYRKFIVENYFPMMVAETGKTFEQLANSAKEQIAHKSFTKDRTGTAGVPLVVDDIFNVMDRHLLGMAQYYAYDQALRDFQRIFKLRPEGQSSLDLTLDEHFGNGKKNKVTNFIYNFIKDVQGAQMQVGEETLLSEKFLSAYKAAQVAGNLSVVAKQPTAIFRAMPEFSAKGIAAMMNFATTKSDIATMIEHSGLAQLKAWGFSENTTAKSVAELYDKNATNLRGKIDDVFSFLAEQADMITWAAIWRASVAETSSLEKAVEKFNEVIRKTQVVKSAFTSSRITEQPGFAKLAFAFKNEPLKTFNYVRSTINDVAEGKEGAKRRAVAVTVATAINTAVVAAISAGFSLLRDDEENTGELFAEKFKENVIADLVSNSTIMLGDIWTAVESAMNNKTVERMDLAVFTDATEFVLNFVDMLKKPESEQKNTWMKIVYDGARTVSNFTGIPIGNVIRAIKSVHGSIVELSDDPVARYNMTKIWYNVEGVDNSSVRAKFRSILTDALDEGDYKAFAEINGDLRRHGFSASDIEKAVSNSARLYDAWNNGAEAFRSEVNKAIKVAPMLSSTYVMEAFKSKKTALVNDLYDAMKSGSKKATSDAMSALLKHRDVDTKRVLTEKDVDKLITKKIESAIKSEVKSKLADLYGTDSYDAVKKKILNEYRHFDMINSEFIDKLARSMN